MEIFKRKSGDTIDLTDLQRKGIIEKAQKIAKENSNQQGYVDFSTFAQKQQEQQPAQLPQPTSTPEITPTESSPLSFLDTFAANASPVPETTQQTSSPSLSAPYTNQEENKQIQHVQVKIEDLEYKLDRLLERLDVLEQQAKETIK